MTDGQEILDAKRQANKLRREIIDARNRWEVLVKENCISQRTARGENNRSPLKVLYIVRDGKWWECIKDEMQKLQRKLFKSENEVVKKQRSMWLPVVIEFPETIRLIVYSATSPKNISLSQARQFLKKAGSVEVLPSQVGNEEKTKYLIKYATGRRYQLQVTYPSGIKVRSAFTEWAVSICKDASSMPILRKARNISSTPMLDVSGAICTREKSALFAFAVGEAESKLSDDSGGKSAEEWN
jgi:hypothetical protein